MGAEEIPTLKEILSRPKLRYLLFAGKGGLGKTTLSAITALWLAKQGKKVIVFSTDPQVSLSDVFEQPLFGKGEVKLAENLYVLEIDADKVVADYQEQIRKRIKEMHGEVPEEIEDYIKSAAAQPAMAESANFDSMMDLIMKEEYDYYIFDMMPHGHAIRFLSMASLLDVWINKIVSVRSDLGEVDERLKKLSGEKFKREFEQDKEILGELLDIKNRLDYMAKIVHGRETTALFYVVIPELMAILDTEVALREFKKFGIQISGVVVNQVYPRELLKEPSIPAFLKNRIEMQQENMKTINEKFGDYIAAAVPMLDKEPKGLETLRDVVKMVYGE